MERTKEQEMSARDEGKEPETQGEDSLSCDKFWSSVTAGLPSGWDQKLASFCVETLKGTLNEAEIEIFKAHAVAGFWETLGNRKIDPSKATGGTMTKIPPEWLKEAYDARPSGMERNSSSEEIFDMCKAKAVAQLLTDAYNCNRGIRTDCSSDHAISVFLSCMAGHYVE